MVIKFRKKKSKLSLAIARYFFPVLFGFGFLFAIFSFLLNEKETLQVAAPLSREVLDLPYTGYSNQYLPLDDDSVAPFVVIAPNDDHYWIRVVDIYTDKEVKSFFLRAGETLETTLPLGGYRIDYAYGKQWYGVEELFGPKTIYSRTQKNLKFSNVDGGTEGHIIRLIKVIDGNLHTKPISKNQFNESVN